MFDFVDDTAYTNDQGKRAQKLFAAVVLAALDDAIADDKKYGNGVESIARWARSRDGREVLMCAGIEPTERCVVVTPAKALSSGTLSSSSELKSGTLSRLEVSVNRNRHEGLGVKRGQ